MNEPGVCSWKLENPIDVRLWAENGKRFVIAVSSWHPGDLPYLTDEWLVVYDVDRRGAIIAFKSDSLPYQQSQSALSADGDRLLIGTGGHLELVRLPN